MVLLFIEHAKLVQFMDLAIETIHLNDTIDRTEIFIVEKILYFINPVVYSKVKKKHLLSFVP